MDARQRTQSGASEFTLYRARFAMPGHRPRLAESRRRAAFGDSLWRASAEHDSARERGVQLGARRVSWLGLRIRDHRSGAGPGRRAAPRSLRYAAVLWLQHGRLLRALALVRAARRPQQAAESLFRELVSQGRQRQMALARL